MNGLINGLILAAVTLILFVFVDPVITVLISTLLLFAYSFFILKGKIY